MSNSLGNQGGLPESGAKSGAVIQHNDNQWVVRLVENDVLKDEVNEPGSLTECAQWIAEWQASDGYGGEVLAIVAVS